MREIFQKNAKSLLLSIQSYQTDILSGILYSWFQLSPTYAKTKRKSKQLQNAKFLLMFKNGIFQEI